MDDNNICGLKIIEKYFGTNVKLMFQERQLQEFEDMPKQYWNIYQI